MDSSDEDNHRMSEDEDYGHRNKRGRVRNTEKIRVIAIVTIDPDSYAIGNADKLPFLNPLPIEKDQFIQRLIRTTKDPTKTNAILIGYQTFMKFPKDPRFGVNSPVRLLLPGILTGVLSTKMSLLNYDEDAPILTSNDAGDLIKDIRKKKDEIETIYVIGGARTFEASYKYWDEVYLIAYETRLTKEIIALDYDYRLNCFNPEEFNENNRQALAERLVVSHYVKPD